ncbi:diguanylate cyclase domain-containing protein [Nocardia sp. NPDC058379]|uniref:diguanylate cyclase domain-containing protein n=1 Tax=unclassified Nocardia TaxID=2637762 RepID=UPI00366060AC
MSRAFAARWAAQLTATVDDAAPPECLVTALETWTERLLTTLATGHPDPVVAQRAGAAVHDLGCADPVTIARSMPILQAMSEAAGAGPAAFGIVAGGFGQGFARTLADAAAPATEGLETAFRHASIAISIGDAHGNIINANPAFERLTGKTLAELQGTSGFDLAEEEVHHARERVHGELERSETGTIRIEGEYERPDGTEGWASWTVTRCVSASGGLYLLGFGEDTTERRTTTERLHWQAHHDPLTALANRRHLLAHLDTLITAAAPDDVAAVCALDMDGFKEINDAFGHTVGDSLLIEVAARLQACLDPETDLLARIGGDEFIAVLPPPADAARIQRTVDLLHAAVDEPFVVADHEIEITISLGAIVSRIAGAEPRDLMTAADNCLYTAKALGKNRWILRHWDPVPTGS